VNDDGFAASTGDEWSPLETRPYPAFGRHADVPICCSESTDYRAFTEVDG
jgi:hypothetical protein